jgi:hypothetical protein
MDRHRELCTKDATGRCAVCEALAERLPLTAGGQTCRPAGLFVLDDTTLEIVFALIGRLALLDDPVIQ